MNESKLTKAVKEKAIEALPKRAKDALWHTINMTLEHQKLKGTKPE